MKPTETAEAPADEEATGKISVESRDEISPNTFAWTQTQPGFSTHTEARQWIKANLQPGDEFRIIKTLQEGRVVGKSDVIVAD